MTPESCNIAFSSGVLGGMVQELRKSRAPQQLDCVTVARTMHVHQCFVFLEETRHRHSSDKMANVNFFYDDIVHEFGEITQHKAITPFKVIQGHRFWYQSKVHIRLPISD